MKIENTEHSGEVNNTRIITRNAFWFGLESAVNLLAVIVTTVAVARVIGINKPGQARLGSYNYVVWLTNISITIGSVGLPATARKYMAEYLNRGQPGVARATYLSTLRIQSYISLGVVGLAMAVLLWLGKPGFFISSALLVAAMAPRLISTVPSMANNASETMRRNTGPSVAGLMTTTFLTLASLLMAYHYATAQPGIAAHNWDLAGLAGAVLVGSALECGMKLRSVERWLGGVARVELDPDLKKRMFTYSSQGLMLLVLNILVWDRSDIVILQYLNPDQGQVLFFSVAFSLAERILLIPGVFCNSIASTIMAQYGRDPSRLKEMTVDGARYALLLALPMLLGLACIGGPMVLLVYGEPYRPLIPTLVIVALMAIPKALVLLPTMLLQAEERQGFLIVWGCLCGVVDIGLDVLLVRQHGAYGAAIANGTAQTMAAVGIWIYVWRTNRLDLKLPEFGRILLSGAIMSAGVLICTRLAPGYLGMFGGIAAGVVLWLVAVRFTGALKPQDVGRFLPMAQSLPPALGDRWKRLVYWLARSGATA